MPALDHSVLQYPEIRRLPSPQHCGTSEWREANGIRLSGSPPFAAPAPEWQQCGLARSLQLYLQGLHPAPTSVQAQCIPLALGGRDILGIAQTGSGKTGAFVWPLLTLLLHQMPSESPASPQAVILAPTRELAKQILQVCASCCREVKLSAQGLFGDRSTHTAATALQKSRVDIVVATPGRLLQFIKKRHVSMREVRYLVLDEADKMLSMGFEAQVRSVVGQLRPDRQTLLFSATFKRRTRQLAEDLLTDSVRVNVGAAGELNQDIEQCATVLPSEDAKWSWLTQRLGEFLRQGSVLLFVGQRQEAEHMAQRLQRAGFHCAALHGDKTHAERKKIHFAFAGGNVRLLVATDVASRGIDVAQVRNVIQWSAPKNLDAYTHRVGRTGRAGQQGRAHSLLLRHKDGKWAGILMQATGRGQGDAGGGAPHVIVFRRGKEASSGVQILKYAWGLLGGSCCDRRLSDVGSYALQVQKGVTLTHLRGAQRFALFSTYASEGPARRPAEAHGHPPSGALP